MKLFEKNLTLRRILILLGGAIVLYTGLDMLYNSCLHTRSGCVTTETRHPVILVVGLMWGMYFFLLKDFYCDTYPLERHPYHELSDFRYINIDLMKDDDRKWMNEIKEQKKKKEKLIAYSKKGSFAAKSRARQLGLDDCFIDFIAYREIKKYRRDHR